MARRPLNLGIPKSRRSRAARSLKSIYRGAQRHLPGPPTSAAGVPNKSYRGLQQRLPGCPTRVTGAPDKNYRGAQQVALFKIAAKWGFYVVFLGPFVFVSLVVLCC